jgi:hypothetical protein
MVVQRRTIHKSGVHSSRSFGIGLPIVSQPTCLSNLFTICSCSRNHARKVWRILMRRWWCPFPLSNVSSWWWPLSLATRADQPPSHRASSRVPSSHHPSHSRVFAIVTYFLKLFTKL